ncbi:hypothetical protein JDV02_004021 [Purpureocillium takamizusanense]|uniref:Uncharacterized protein n=1 Tax=Purpureocillium takamizusanense TaxID=2060973 RepID=A0A9Q8QEC6_9HYPO|nr:uncharacterized protein JDV02_004021 [Purpureocillium takamizusanense]UNI17697.1 hypothetical protein JDV02_004021 [Purpureocillium takamizusanense]
MEKTITTRKTERSHEENQERAYIAASRRTDRSLEARVQSARMASDIHKKRTGKGFRITEQIVMKEEMYEEEEDNMPRSFRLLAPHLLTESPDVNHRLQDFVDNRCHMSSLLARTNEQWRKENEINKMFAASFPHANQQAEHLTQSMSRNMFQNQSMPQGQATQASQPPYVPSPSQTSQAPYVASPPAYENHHNQSPFGQYSAPSPFATQSPPGFGVPSPSLSPRERSAILGGVAYIPRSKRRARSRSRSRSASRARAPPAAPSPANAVEALPNPGSQPDTPSTRMTSSFDSAMEPETPAGYDTATSIFTADLPNDVKMLMSPSVNPADIANSYGQTTYGQEWAMAPMQFQDQSSMYTPVKGDTMADPLTQLPYEDGGLDITWDHFIHAGAWSNDQ